MLIDTSQPKIKKKIKTNNGETADVQPKEKDTNSKQKKEEKPIPRKKEVEKAK